MHFSSNKAGTVRFQFNVLKRVDGRDLKWWGETCKTRFKMRAWIRSEVNKISSSLIRACKPKLIHANQEGLISRYLTRHLVDPIESDRSFFFLVLHTHRSGEYSDTRLIHSGWRGWTKSLCFLRTLRERFRSQEGSPVVTLHLRVN